ncbi:MAG: hypothetical protein U9M98_00255 [Patescibacteria group bacterium]|nr:hypothetical protein [Patescibacteria group bacterium]
MVKFIKIIKTKIRSLFALIKGKLGPFRYYLLAFTALGIFVDTFFFDFTSDLVILFFIFLWIMASWLFSFEGRVSVGVGLGFLVLCPFLLIFKADFIAEKAAVWAYMFLLVGVVHEIIEFREERTQEANTK